MEARWIVAALSLCALLSPSAEGSTFETKNFIVHASTPELAKEVGDAAERYRKELADYWLGRELPPWRDRCPIVVSVRPNLLASGDTTFTYHEGTVGRWRMNVRGTRERVLDSVVPHEISHTILATHFARFGNMNKPVPRWADEGACTTLEHISERGKFDNLLIQYLNSGKGISFQELYHIKDYPADPLPLYAQGYSVVSFLIAQGGPRKFVNYLHDGLSTDDWSGATQRAYGYKGLGHLKNNWLAWVGDGGGEDISRYVANPQLAPVASLASAATPVPPLNGDPTEPVTQRVSEPSIEVGAATSLKDLASSRSDASPSKLDPAVILASNTSPASKTEPMSGIRPIRKLINTSSKQSPPETIWR